jgi:hypothetical protein
MSTADLISEIDATHDTLRRAQFDERLLRCVETREGEWRTLRASDETAYIQGRCVAAETLDYFGKYTAAADSLAQDSRSVLEPLLNGDLDKSTETPALWKRRIWLVLAKAQVAYRKEDYDEADTLFRDCERAADRLNPESDRLFGTRARLAYFQGQLFRQRGQIVDARAQFASAVSWATKRFIAETGFAELSGPPVGLLPTLDPDLQAAFDHARLLANWTIGKCQALGLGWIELTTGNLALANMHLHAGYGMLRGTGDWIHRAYSILLLGVAERALAGTDQRMLTTAIARMNDAKKGLGDHPFRLRACYELAQAYLRVDKTHEARHEIQTMLKALPAPDRANSQERRWRCNGTIVLSRIERIAGNHGAAERIAREAVELAARADGRAPARIHGEAWTEARIALAEALMERARSASDATLAQPLLEEAIRSLSAACDHAAGNPKTAAVCRFHLARAQTRLGRERDAVDEYLRGVELARTVEHGFVATLRRQTYELIESQSTFFISQSLTYVDPATGQARQVSGREAERLLHAFMVRRAEVLEGSRENVATRLDIDKRTVRRWTLEGKAPFKIQSTIDD